MHMKIRTIVIIECCRPRNLRGSVARLGHVRQRARKNLLGVHRPRACCSFRTRPIYVHRRRTLPCQERCHVRSRDGLRSAAERAQHLPIMKASAGGLLAALTSSSTISRANCAQPSNRFQFIRGSKESRVGSALRRSMVLFFCV